MFLFVITLFHRIAEFSRPAASRSLATTTSAVARKDRDATIRELKIISGVSRFESARSACMRACVHVVIKTGLNYDFRDAK